MGHYSKRSTLKDSYLDLLKIRERPARELPEVAKRTKATHTSPEVRERVLEEYAAGVPVEEIAKKHAITRSTINHLVHAAGAEIRFRGLTGAQVTEAARLYASGESLAMISRRFDVNPSTIRSYLQKAGVSLRPRNGWPAQPQSASPPK